MKKNNLYITIGLIAVLIIVLLIFFRDSENVTASAEFAQCLSDKGAIMYGTEWCGHCKEQKGLFSDSFQYVDYVDCDINRDSCTAAGVRGYPTWRIDEKNYEGTQSLENLAEISGCELA